MESKTCPALLSFLYLCRKLENVNLFLAKKYLGYYLRPNHWRGYGIHSPFIFDLVANLLREKHAYYDFNRIEAWRSALMRSKQKIEITDLGAGSLSGKKGKRRISDLVAMGALPPKYGQLLYRLACRFEAKNVLELSTSAGISTLYLALPYKKGKTITIEGCPESSKLARTSFEQLDARNIKLLEGSFSDLLPEALKELQTLDMVFFDGDHREKSTLNYFELCLPHVHNNTIFVFDDIHWSPGMERAWNKIAAHSKVSISIDLLRLGLVFFRKENQKEHFVVRY